MTGYGLRNYAELDVQRYKRIFGNVMKACALAQQKTEAWISASVLNRVTKLGRAEKLKLKLMRMVP
ncbi:hypothetical protein C7H79_15185 [Nitrosomonas supralitoralis]|uniref:Uncharacterized protein n=1 Tax=Nitrosomonas supralitoralis TaxID=2116706 RepID=A0A2P7NRN9_9PROT|nr:hypothetical protein C7H79_15185 [Nitrosomonas supralitoralis]